MSSDEILSIIGLRIREKRDDLGITQEDLAKRIGKNKSDISSLENAKFPNPTIKTLTLIANALGIEVWELLIPHKVPSYKKLESNVLQEFKLKLSQKKFDLSSEELTLLENLRIKGQFPRTIDVYLLFFILHRAFTKDGMDKLFD